jgi:signal transduction histidine kinase
LFTVHRIRIAKAVAIERMRNRIATDLHDDVGASLCHAALLSDLLDRDISIQNSAARERLSQISGVCREALDSMRHIVWAIDPKKDNARDMVRRMRAFAEEMLEPSHIELTFVEDTALDLVLASEVRHHVFLVFKEAVHNVVRHSGATSAHIEISIDEHHLSLRISDNGRGVVPDTNGGGHGLASMRQRAAALGGSISMDSDAQAGGTSLTLSVPLRTSGATRAAAVSV